jgi:hypothetical protein
MILDGSGGVAIIALLLPLLANQSGRAIPAQAARRASRT